MSVEFGGDKKWMQHFKASEIDSLSPFASFLKQAGVQASLMVR